MESHKTSEQVHICVSHLYLMDIVFDIQRACNCRQAYPRFNLNWNNFLSNISFYQDLTLFPLQRSGSVVSLGIQFAILLNLFEGTKDNGKKLSRDCIDRPQSNIIVISRNVSM
nr:unnamed protein product [Callosobruchus chinensis]